MNKELFEALELLEAEKGIPVDFMLEKKNELEDFYAQKE